MQEDKEKRRLEQLEKKKENARLLEEESATLKTAKPAASSKVTRAEIETNRARMAAEGTSHCMLQNVQVLVQCPAMGSQDIGIV